jgi:hypothetical protein
MHPRRIRSHSGLLRCRREADIPGCSADVAAEPRAYAPARGEAQPFGKPKPFSRGGLGRFAIDVEEELL